MPSPCVYHAVVSFCGTILAVYGEALHDMAQETSKKHPGSHVASYRCPIDKRPHVGEHVRSVIRRAHNPD